MRHLADLAGGTALAERGTIQKRHDRSYDRLQQLLDAEPAAASVPVSRETMTEIIDELTTWTGSLSCNIAGWGGDPALARGDRKTQRAPGSRRSPGWLMQQADKE